MTWLEATLERINKTSETQVTQHTKFKDPSNFNIACHIDIWFEQICFNLNGLAKFRVHYHLYIYGGGISA
jgi:hypothetical protein